jgi:hypothetical protein
MLTGERCAHDVRCSGSGGEIAFFRQMIPVFAKRLNLTL